MEDRNRSVNVQIKGVIEVEKNKKKNRKLLK